MFNCVVILLAGQKIVGSQDGTQMGAIQNVKLDEDDD
jgi:sporulation protein YlmC with PRC-barrel domain